MGIWAFEHWVLVLLPHPPLLSLPLKSLQYLIPCYTRPFRSCLEELSLIFDKIRRFPHVKLRQWRIHSSLKYVSRV